MEYKKTVDLQRNTAKRFQYLKQNCFCCFDPIPLSILSKRCKPFYFCSWDYHAMCFFSATIFHKNCRLFLFDKQKIFPFIFQLFQKYYEKCNLSFSDISSELRATKEKDKGNEAFRAGDIDEAIVYYNRSISLHETPTVYNNRAMAYIKMEKFEDAIKDCDIVLQKEPDNIKGESGYFI